MRINHNIASLNTYRQLTMNNNNGAKSLEKLSSGYRINRAGDDAAGLAISEKMRAQIRGLDMASKNSQDAISMIQTAEGALAETQSILQRMRELAVQASNDTNVSVDRDQIQKEINQLTSEINRIGTATEFNTMKLLNGDKAEIVTTTSSVGLGSGNASVNLITGYTVAGTSEQNFKDAISAFAIDNTGEFYTAGVGGTNNATIAVDKTSATTMKVALHTSGASTLTVTDIIEADENGDFVYNDHGVSFTVTAEEWATISVNSDVDITGLTVTGSTTLSLNNDWTSNNSGNVTMTSGITVAVNADNQDVRKISIVAGSTGTDITVTLKNSAGTTLFNDVYSGSATLDYDAHGISFHIAVSSAGGTMTDKSLTALVTTTTTSTSSYSAGLTFQVGANEGQELSLNVGDMRASALSISATASGTSGFVSTAGVSDGNSSTLVQYAVDVSSNAEAASNAVTVFNQAISAVSEERAKLGAVQNRLEHTISNLDTTAENLQASESRIRDVDMAKEMMEFTRNNILMQAAQSMLAQANQQPQGVLQLLR